MKGELHHLWKSGPYVNNCAEVTGCGKKECPAFKQKDVRCWHITGTYCNLVNGHNSLVTVEDKWDQCKECRVFTMATDTPEKRMAELVNNVVFALKCFDPASIRNITIKKNFERLALHFNFTTREREVALLLLDRFSRKEIAKKLSISLETVKMHYKNIFKKVGVNSKEEITTKLHDYCLTHYPV